MCLRCGAILLSRTPRGKQGIRRSLGKILSKSSAWCLEVISRLGSYWGAINTSMSLFKGLARTPRSEGCGPECASCRYRVKTHGGYLYMR